MRPVAKHLALSLVFLSNDRGKFCGWEEGIAIGETHALRKEITLWKMSFADAVVVSFNCCVFLRPQHGADFRMLREFEEIVVVPGIAAERLLGSIQQFNLAVDWHFLKD